MGLSIWSVSGRKGLKKAVAFKNAGGEGQASGKSVKEWTPPAFRVTDPVDIKISDLSGKSGSMAGGFNGENLQLAANQDLTMASGYWDRPMFNADSTNLTFDITGRRTGFIFEVKFYNPTTNAEFVVAQVGKTGAGNHIHVGMASSMDGIGNDDWVDISAGDSVISGVNLERLHLMFNVSGNDLHVFGYYSDTVTQVNRQLNASALVIPDFASYITDFSQIYIFGVLATSGTAANVTIPTGILTPLERNAGEISLDPDLITEDLIGIPLHLTVAEEFYYGDEFLEDDSIVMFDASKSIMFYLNRNAGGW